jgi:feruloyl esterase
MSIGNIPDLALAGLPATVDGVVTVPANLRGDDAPGYCLATGTVVTNAATGKTANFAATLPAKSEWNGKFMFEGCGGNCGIVMMKLPAEALRKGYPIFASDDGHIASSPGELLGGSWAVSSPGRRNSETTADFFHRAVHAVVESGKSLTRQYYRAPRLSYAYFDGCSDGGREGMVELSRYPADFDGVIAGNPYFDIGAEIANSLVAVQAQLRTVNSALTPLLLSQIDQIVSAKCDAADGVSDGLIQNPAKCAFDPEEDLPKCGAGSADGKCFVQDQIDSLSAVLSAITDSRGKVIYPGYPVGALAGSFAAWAVFHAAPDSPQGPEPWNQNPAGRPFAWSFGSQTARYLIYTDAADFDALKTPGITFSKSDAGPFGFHAVMPQATAGLLVRQSAEGNGNNPAAAAEFFRQGRKVIIYHGYGDQDISPYRTIQYYQALAKLHGGYAATQKNARLFMVPGMAHCAGGPGPNVFGQTGVIRAAMGPHNDVLEALESWVERGIAPKSIVAAKYESDDLKKTVMRTMPLCPFPAMAKYKGSGDANDAANWSCPADDRTLLDLGRTGQKAGADASLN